MMEKPKECFALYGHIKSLKEELIILTPQILFLILYLDVFMVNIKSMSFGGLGFFVVLVFCWEDNKYDLDENNANLHYFRKRVY